MEKEKKLVTLSMVILFFSLIVVYSLFYQVKGQKLIHLLQSVVQTGENTVVTGKVQTMNLDLMTGAEEENIE